MSWLTARGGRQQCTVLKGPYGGRDLDRFVNLDRL